MAIVKHITSHNMNYGNSVDYLTQQYDEKLCQPKLDEYGNLQEREAYLISYTRSDGSKGDLEDWSRDCNMINTKYNQNRKPSDIRTHHYIVAFEDQDNISLEDSQKFGEDLAKEMFPGQNYLVAAHPEGHVHIVCNSVRDQEREKAEYMARDEKDRIKRYEYEAGKKHNCSAKFLRHMKVRVMEMCQERGLSQSIDLTKPAKVKKTDKEYHAEKNAAKEGKITQKEFVRRAINQAKEQAKTPAEFMELLKEKGIQVERRGKNVRYKTESGEKWIREKSLGTDFTIEAVSQHLQAKQYAQENASVKRAVEMQRKADAELIAQARLKFAENKQQRHMEWALGHHEDGTSRSLTEQLVVLAAYIITGEMPGYMNSREMFEDEKKLEECRETIRKFNQRQQTQSNSLDSMISGASGRRTTHEPTNKKKPPERTM